MGLVRGTLGVQTMVHIAPRKFLYNPYVSPMREIPEHMLGCQAAITKGIGRMQRV